MAGAERKGGDQVKDKPKAVTKRPQLYHVVLINDDYTTMEFVVQTLEEIFDKGPAEAHRIMMEVHTRGRGVCGAYSFEVAETKVAKVHGPREASLHPLHDAFRELAASLGPHLDEEEAVLFPALMARTPDAPVVKKELDQMHEEHLAVGDLLARIRALTSGFQTPEWGCNTYRVIMSELDALEADILRHVHMENHVLAPRFG